MPRRWIVLLGVAAAIVIAWLRWGDAVRDLWRHRPIGVPFEESFRAQLADDSLRAARGDSTALEMLRFYQAHRRRPAWLSGPRPSREARDLVALLLAAEDHGLSPADYDAAPLDTMLRMLDEAREARSRDSVRVSNSRVAALRKLGGMPKQPLAGDSLLSDGWLLATLDRRLTRSYLRFAAHRAYGRWRPDTLTPAWHTLPPARRDLVEHLADALRHRTIAASLDSLDPKRPEYARLRDALAWLRAVQAAGGWPEVPRGEPLRWGADDPRVAAVRRRLAASGDLVAARERDTTSTFYDAELAGAVRTFQRRHGLRPSGQVHDVDVRAMNVPVEDRIERVAINLDRWRITIPDFGERHLVVNLPEFALHVFERDTLRQTIGAVIGQDTTRTPVFDDLVTYLVFGPTWRVPMSILRNEILPAMKRDRKYLEKNHMRVFGGTSKKAVELRGDSIPWRRLHPDSIRFYVRQEPGPDNPLGRVKFMCPNPWDVYLHDTPSRGPFQRMDRRASHGCVRLERPLDLARWLLFDKNPPWDSLAIATAMDSSADRVIGLKTPVPVHFVYRTAWVDSAGRANFRSDVYGYDTLHARAVGRPLERLPRLARRR